jgi:beta-glucosidase
MGNQLTRHCNLLVLPLMTCAVVIGCASSPSGKTSASTQASSPVKSPSSDSGGPGGSTNEMGIYKKGNVDPFLLFMGSPSKWDDPVSDSGKHATIKVEPGQVSEPNDGKKVTWTGTGQFFAGSTSNVDRKSFVMDGALVFDMVIHEPPKAAVSIRVDCGYPCIGTIEAATHLKSLPVGQKSTVKIPLACFEAVGTDFTKVSSPFLVFTASRFVASFANIRWVKGAAKDPDVMKCKTR